ncbi:SDR family NAD(P)-dependent oxidoreductase [Rhodoferax sp. WC2427]|uniref:SDR family NAD(P)-dependent oxidoreductase n=1 Tax=Rhodoferax sp. WC2427 TaxID=3234144 RepID=UPI003467968E
MDRFHQRVALVTGAGSGIGAAIATRLAQEGAVVVVADRDFPAALAISAGLDARGFVAFAVELDVTSDEQIRRVVEEVSARHGHLDVLVNNAGIHCGGSFEDTSLANWRQLMAVNVEGTMRLSLAGLPLLKASRRPTAIVNLSSISGLGGDFGQAAYATSKGAVSHLTRSMALDLAKFGIRVNAVCPGSVRTPMFEAAVAKLDPNQVDEAFAKAYPMGRIAEPAEVASAVAFLASDDASFISGVNLPVDGGLTAHNGAPRFDG